MHFTHVLKMPTWIKKNIVWIFVVNIILIVLYASIQYKFQTTNTKHFKYATAHRFPLKPRFNNSLNVAVYKPFHIKDIQKVLSSDCVDAVFPAHLSPEVTWRPIDGKRSAFVFSVYFMKDHRKLIIIGAKEKDFSLYFCQFWYSESRNESFTMKQQNAKVISLPEGHGRRYSATLFECSLPSSTLPAYISVVNESCAEPQHLLRFFATAEQETPKKEFTVCLTPLNSHYNNVYGLVEWIELNRILGAEKFIIYNYSSGIDVQNVLQYYSKRNLTEVIQWRLPMKVDSKPDEAKPPEIHYYGQSAALHDCLYRSKPHSEFIVNIDLDEYIIPHANHMLNWSEMVTHLFKLNRKVPSAYIFRNTFFRMEWSNDNIVVFNKTEIEKYRLVTLQKFEHENKIFPPTIRSKYFARTASVSSVMIHTVWDVTYSSLTVVPPKVGLLHHYRNCEDLSSSSGERIVDKTVINKYGVSLLNNVQNVWSEIGDGN